MTPLERIRTQRGLKQVEVARAVGVNKSHYYNVEIAKAAASPALARRIARFFGNAVTEHQVLYPEDYIGADSVVPEPTNV